MYTKFGALGMSHILDDFLFVGPPDRFNCRADLTNFLFLCTRLNVPIKLGKTVPPTTCLTIYGIEVDTVSMECRLPQDKVKKQKQTTGISRQIQKFLKGNSVSYWSSKLCLLSCGTRSGFPTPIDKPYM